MVQNNDTMLKVSRLLATGLEILVANAKFSVALASSWSQFRTLMLNSEIFPVLNVTLVSYRDLNLQNANKITSIQDSFIIQLLVFTSK